MNILIIGYGSIGKRHEEVLSTIEGINTVDIVTKQSLKNKKSYLSLEEETLNLEFYDYFIIASETNKHYEQLVFLENKVKQKIILCEKPLFETSKILNIVNNIVYVGYVLRFHPLLQKLKKLVEEERIIAIIAQCGQYLPTWRPESDYRTTYSAYKEKGGGVLLDLSHELDYVQWLSGEVSELKSYQEKISDLEISSDDMTMFIGKTVEKVMVNVTIDYISKQTHRSLIVHTLQNTYMLDFIEGTLLCKSKEGDSHRYELKTLERNSMFKSMHEAVVKEKHTLCSYDEAKLLMQTITKIQEQNNE